MKLHGTGAVLEPPSLTEKGEAQINASAMSRLVGDSNAFDDLFNDLQRLERHDQVCYSLLSNMLPSFKCDTWFVDRRLSRTRQLVAILPTIYFTEQNDLSGMLSALSRSTIRRQVGKRGEIVLPKRFWSKRGEDLKHARQFHPSMRQMRSIT